MMTLTMMKIVTNDDNNGVNDNDVDFDNGNKTEGNDYEVQLHFCKMLSFHLFTETEKL